MYIVKKKKLLTKARGDLPTVNQQPFDATRKIIFLLYLR